jgi:S-adenosylmethionine synthetase
MTIAAAMVDRFISDARTYFDRKEEVRQFVEGRLRAELRTLDELDVMLNTLDDPKRGLGGMYLTVLGTSAEGADGGEVGRGNRVNGVISLHRPMSTEAAAGKNPVSHVGNIYNVLAHQIAGRIVQQVTGVEETAVWLCSQIGRPLDDPWSVSVELIPRGDVRPGDLDAAIEAVVDDELRQLPTLVDQLSRGEIPIC